MRFSLDVDPILSLVIILRFTLPVTSLSAAYAIRRISRGFGGHPHEKRKGVVSP